VRASATSFPLFKHTGGGDTVPAFSGLRVCLQFAWEVGVPPLSCGVFLPLPLLQAFLLVITGQCCCSCQPPCFFTAHVGNGSSLLSCGVFLPSPLSQAFPLLVAGCVPPLPREPLQPTRLVYLQFREGSPSPNLRRSVHPTLFPVCLYCSYCLLLSFSFFPGGGRSVQGAMLLWPGVVCGSTVVLLSSPCLCLPKPSGHGWLVAGSPGAFLIFPFNMKWRCSELAGGVEGQSFASSRWFCLQGVSPASLQDFTIGGTLSPSSL
jgi:hypothetical protein